MIELDAALDENHKAVEEFIASAERCEAIWRTPRAPGKWSPSQLSEHVARSLEESANDVAGLPSKLPRVPALLRPIVRKVLIERVLRTETFPKARTNKPMNPETGPASPSQARVRLQDALARLDQACRERAASGKPVDSSFAGKVPVADYARFQALHTRHHGRQFPAMR